MAFNPFHRFRKHKKGVFAVLTIICMFVFVMQFGRGDPIERIMGLFGSGKARGEFVMTLNGKKFYTADLEKLSLRRKIANDFLVMISEVARNQTLDEAAKVNKEADLQNRDSVISQILFHEGMRNPQNRNREAKSPAAIADDIRNDLNELIREKKKGKTTHAELYDALAASLKYEFWAINPDRRSALYFGGSLSPENLLDFELWKQQADKLGIAINLTDLRKAINAEVGRPDFLPVTGPWKHDNKLLGVFRTFKNLTEDELTDLLSDEFRVLMAQEALVGETTNRGPLNLPDSIDRSPAAYTPLEYLQFFKENRTTLKVALLDLPVESFLGKVRSTPTDSELERLFNKYKEDERAPDSDTPGFKVPRRVRVEYVSARPDTPFYKDAARIRFMQPGLAQIGAFCTAYTAGRTAGWLAVTATPVALGDPVQREYERYTSSYRSWLPPTTMDFNKDFYIHENSFLGGDTVATLVLQVAGTQLTGGFAPAAPAAYVRQAFANEVRSRIRALPAAVLAGAAATTAPLAAPGVAMGSIPAPPSLAQMKPILVDTVIKDLAPQIVHENIDKVTDELFKLRNKSDEAKKYIEKAVKEFGLSFHSMTEPKDRYTMEDDPALKELKSAYDKIGFGQANPLAFVPNLFAGTATFEPMAFSADTGFVRDQQSLMRWKYLAEEPFVVWRSEDKPARVRDFAEARADVAAAWKLIEAQRLARKEADRIKEQDLKRCKSAVDVIPFLRELKVGVVPPDPLSGIALLVPSLQPGRYQPYNVPRDVIAHPPRAFVERLMNLKKPLDSIVLEDQPQGHYYVAVLMDRVEPAIEKNREFVESYELTPLRDATMPQMLLNQRRNQFRKRFMEQLRVEAAGRAMIDDLGFFKIPANIELRKTESQDEG